MPQAIADSPRVVGPYLIHREIGSGGMAVVHLGRRLDAAAPLVAIKHLHDQFARDPELVEMMMDEARLAARIHHPNVVPILDVVAARGELFLVLELVHGVPLTYLLRRARQAGAWIAPPIAVAIACQILAGLHGVHEARDEDGERLGIVHRDINPQNVMVGADGVVRILDLGIAKARARFQSTGLGVIKGKLRYMAPEQAAGQQVDRRADVFAASAVLWEMLVGESRIKGDTPQAMVEELARGEPPAPSSRGPGVSCELDRVVLTGLALEVARRYASAEAMASALQAACEPAPVWQVGKLVVELCGDYLDHLQEMRADTETAWARAIARAPGDRTVSEGRAAPPSAASAPSVHAGPPPARLPSWGKRVVILSAVLLGALLLAIAAALVLRAPTPSLQRTAFPTGDSAKVPCSSSGPGIGAAGGCR